MKSKRGGEVAIGKFRISFSITAPLSEACKAIGINL